MNLPDSTMERDLRAIDEALAGARRDPDREVRELQDLALALSAGAPEPDAEFAATLRARVESGFPPAPGSVRARLAAAPRPRLPALLPAAGFAGMFAVVVTLAAVVLPNGPSGSGDDNDSGGSVSSSGGGRAAEAPAPPAAPEQQGAVAKSSAPQALDSAQPVPAPGGGFVPGRSDRKIERSIALELAAPVDEMERVADRLTAVTNRYGGFVLSSSLSTGEDEAGGDFDLRIPAAQLRPALRDLSALATVRSQSQSGRDVTRQHVTAQDRLRSARAERASLLRRLAAADTDAEAEGLRRRLDLVAGEIHGLRSRLRSLRLSTNYATVSVSLVRADGKSGAGGGTFDDAVDDAGNLLVGTAGVLIRVLALALPLGAIALAAWLGTSAFRRRRRESALV